MKTYSMTGFGRASGESRGVAVTVEVRSVNHRFLDVVAKLPPLYSELEIDINRICREKLTRGRVDVQVTRVAPDTGGYEVKLNQGLLSAYLTACNEALSIAKVKSASVKENVVLQALNRREIVEPVFVAQLGDAERKLLSDVMAKALESLCSMRAHEGALLADELLRLLTQIEQFASQMRGLADSLPQLFRERLQLRLEKLSPEVAVDPARLAQEVAILADRTDITEELSRLEAHAVQFKTLVKTPGSGRKLDFLVQEMGREINTCGSKAQNSAIQHIVIEAKSVLEKMREQVQNIE